MDTRAISDLSHGQYVWVWPNRSLSPRGMLLVFIVVAVVAMIVGIGFSLAGAWLILPFAGLEITVVGVVLYWLFRHADDHELIVIGDERVTIIRHCCGHERRDEFQRYWVKIILERHHGWYPSKLKMGSHGRLVVIGHELRDEARQALFAQLNQTLHATDGAV